jgi:hypothetical protein
MDCPMQPLLLAYNEPWEAGEVQEMESSLPLKRLHCKNSPQRCRERVILEPI